MLGPLREQTAAPIAAAHRLAATSQHWSRSAAAAAAMNSYYTNRIEGQRTLPADIERAASSVRCGCGAGAQAATGARALGSRGRAGSRGSRQRIPGGLYGAGRFNPTARCCLQTTRLPGDGIEVLPGLWRDRRSKRQPASLPPPEGIPALLEAWGQHYRGLPGGEAEVIGALCARTGCYWIVHRRQRSQCARLHTHIVLHALG